MNVGPLIIPLSKEQAYQFQDVLSENAKRYYKPDERDSYKENPFMGKYDGSKEQLDFLTSNFKKILHLNDNQLNNLCKVCGSLNKKYDFNSNGVDDDFADEERYTFLGMLKDAFSFNTYKKMIKNDKYAVPIYKVDEDDLKRIKDYDLFGSKNLNRKEIEEKYHNALKFGSITSPSPPPVTTPTNTKIGDLRKEEYKGKLTDEEVEKRRQAYRHRHPIKQENTNSQSTSTSTNRVIQKQKNLTSGSSDTTNNFLNDYPKLKETLGWFGESPIHLGAGVLGTILVGYGLYKAAKAYKAYKEGNKKLANNLMNKENLPNNKKEALTIIKNSKNKKIIHENFSLSDEEFKNATTSTSLFDLNIDNLLKKVALTCMTLEDKCKKLGLIIPNKSTEGGILGFRQRAYDANEVLKQYDLSNNLNNNIELNIK